MPEGAEPGIPVGMSSQPMCVFEGSKSGCGVLFTAFCPESERSSHSDVRHVYLKKCIYQLVLESQSPTKLTTYCLQ